MRLEVHSRWVLHHYGRAVHHLDRVILNTHLKASVGQIVIGLKRDSSHHHFPHVRESRTLLDASRGSCDLASVAYLPERKVEVLAVPADPVPDPLGQRLLDLLLHALILIHERSLLIKGVLDRGVCILQILVLFVANRADLVGDHGVKGELLGWLVPYGIF